MLILRSQYLIDFFVVADWSLNYEQRETQTHPTEPQTNQRYQFHRRQNETKTKKAKCPELMLAKLKSTARLPVSRMRFIVQNSTLLIIFAKKNKTKQTKLSILTKSKCQYCLLLQSCYRFKVQVFKEEISLMFVMRSDPGLYPLFLRQHLTCSGALTS